MKYFKFVIILILIVVIFFGANHLYSSYLKENPNIRLPIDDINLSASDFALNTIDNRTIRLSDYKEKSAVVLNFWASWCPPCEDEMPHFSKLEKEYEQVTFLMINLTSQEKSKATVEKFLKDNNYSFTNVLLDEFGELSSKYEIYSIPVTIFIDKQGNIINKRIGKLDEQTLRIEIENMF